MSLKISVKNLDKIDKLFTNLKNNIKPTVIDKSLDQILAEDLTKLKIELINVVNNEIRSKITVQEQPGKVEEISVKKSDQEILKHLTGVDLEKVTKTKDFNILADGKVAIVSNKTLNKATIDQMNGKATSRMSSGVNLRLPMSGADTFENQYAQALDYYNKAIFVFVDNHGKTNYYMNPGMDMTKYVKVVCSNKTGDTERSRQVFDRYKDGTRPGNRLATSRGQDYADWTLTKEGLDVVKNNFINITDALEKVKEGDHAEAKTIINRTSQRSTQQTSIIEKIDDLKDKKKLEPTVESYNNIIRLVKNLKIEKSIRKDRTFYTLISNYDENTQDYEKFQERLIELVKMWKISNEQRWVSTIIKSIVKLVNKLLR